MIQREDIVMAARKWIDTPWRHQGRTLGKACDCAGLIIGVMRDLGAPCRDVVGYPRRPDGTSLRASCDEQMARIDRYDIGDVLLFAIGVHPQHLGIVGDYPHGGHSLIHAYAQARRVVEHRLDDVWQGRIVAAYRIA